MSRPARRARLAPLVLAAALAPAASCGSGSDHGAASQNPYAGYVSATYAGTDQWLCHPGLTGSADVCSGDLSTIRVQADGSSTTEAFTPAADPPVDCFYLYPTVSFDLAANSDLDPGAQETGTTLIQAARYGSVCRVFAPVYRQRTLVLLGLRLFAPFLVPDDVSAKASAIAYGDVLDAFRHYIANENHGRGFFLLGHSQGAGLSARLIAEEIETQPYLAARLIAAHIPGATVAVPKGADVGGTLASTPACTRADQTGCVVAYSTFRQGDPDLAEPRFGVTGDPATQALCVNAAALVADAASTTPATLDAYLPFLQPPIFQAILIARGEGGPYADPAQNRAAAKGHAFYSVPGQLHGQCVVDPASTASYLEVTIESDPTDPRADDYPGEFLGGKGWGLHLVDVSMVQGDLVRLAATQAAAWRR